MVDSYTHDTMRKMLLLWLFTLLLATEARPELKSSSNGNLTSTLNDLTSTGSSPGSGGRQPYLRLSGESRRSEGRDFCRKAAKCQTLNNTICLGTKLPYTQTSLELVGDSHTQGDVQDKLLLWQSLRSVPKCWAVIQPFLCALYMPRCENGLVELPSQEMCKVIRNPCRIVALEHKGSWPDFMKCEDAEKFPSGCKNEVRELKFNTTAKCHSPLVETDNSQAFVDGVEGCGVPCANPLLTHEEHQQVQRFTLTLAAMCLATNVFAVATFLIDWRSASRYPAVIIFYMNVCFAAACVGWLSQFVPGARQDITCRKDGTPRVSEPSAGETLSCVVVFILIYYSLMAACVWFVMLSYSWYISFQALGKIREKVSSKAAYFHLVSWSVPLVLTITCMALAQVDAQSPHGICFVAMGNPVVRSGFVLAPVVLLLLVGHVFLVKGLLVLVRLRLGSAHVISASANSKLRSTIVRLVSFAVTVVACVVLTLYCHVYEFQRQDDWKISFRSYMVCLANQTASRILQHGWAEPCELEGRPSMTLTQLHPMAVFCAGVAVSSWVWTKASVLAWRRWYRRKFHKRPLDERVRIRKHKIIAQAFAKRRDLSHMGRMSISINSTHDDPVGFNIDLNSAASQDVSSAWAAAIPKFVTRRGAVVGAAGAFGLRRNSLDSDISLSAVRRISVGSQSRRHSLDSHHSQYSIQSHATDLERLSRLHLRGAGGTGGGGGGGGRKRTLLRGAKGRRLALSKRRGSVTSQASSRGSQILPAITKRRELLLSRSTIAAGGAADAGSCNGNGGSVGVGVGEAGGARTMPADLERIERFSLNLPGDASSDDSDLEAGRTGVGGAGVVAAAGVGGAKKTGQSMCTQTTCTWDVATQTSPTLALRPRLVSSSSPAAASASQSKATQMTPPASSSAESTPEVAPKSSHRSTSKCVHRERGQADGSPNGSSASDVSDAGAVASPSQTLLDFLLPVSGTSQLDPEHGVQVSKSKSRRSRTNSGARSRAARADVIELDRASIARLLEKLRDDDHHHGGASSSTAAAADGDRSAKRSYDRRRSERNRRHDVADQQMDDLELDYLLSSKNSNRSDRSKKSNDRHRSRSKQADSSIDVDAI